jgi:hypothetical protein
MTCFLTALTNDPARLIVKEARVSHDPLMWALIQKTWEAEGYVVLVRYED